MAICHNLQVADLGFCDRKIPISGVWHQPPRLAGMVLAVLAHQGGWDEALLVAGPLLLFAGIIWNAKRRAVRQSQTQTGSDE